MLSRARSLAKQWFAPPPVQSGEAAGDDSNRNRIFYALAIAGTLLLLPFSVNNFLQHRELLGFVIALLVASFIANALAVRAGWSPPVPAGLMFVPVLAALGIAMSTQQLIGILWSYPALLLFHFILARRTANLFNAAIVLMAGWFSYHQLGPELCVRVVVTLLLTIIFANVVSRISEHQQRSLREQVALTRARELELTSGQRRLDLVVHAALVGIVDWDGATHATYYSPRFREILGHAPDADTSVWPDYFKVLLHPEDRERVTQRWRSFILGKNPGGGQTYYAPEEYRLLRADGNYVWVQVSGVAVRDGKGFVTRWIAAVTDITERRAQEETLARERERLALLVNSTKAGFSDWDAVGDVVTYSDRYKEMLGYPAEIDSSRWPSIFEWIHPEDRESARMQFRTMIQRKKTAGVQEPGQPMEYRLRHADGRYIWIHAEGIAEVDAAGRTRRFITSVIDITRYREQEEALRQSVRLREEVERMSRHDLKTPLNSVIAVARMLRENTRPDTQDAELLDTLERAGYSILNMVNLSLDMFRMENGSYLFRPQAVELGAVATRVATDLRSQAASKHIEVRVASAGTAVARAEELLCYSMFANLLKNAIEAAPEGSIVTVSLQTIDGDVVVRIHNAGAVPEALRPQFFQKYATSGKPSGLGLGAYSAQLLARVQNGDLSLDTSAEEGTTLTLQLAAATGPAAQAAAAQRTEKAATAPDASSLPALHVLVVDDDEFNRLVLRRYLPTPPLRVSFAVNGSAPLDAAAAQWPDVVLLDLEMPVMDGYQAAGSLRALERANGHAPCTIIAISSNDEEAITNRALAAGCDHCLAKPAPRELLWKILSGAAVPPTAGGAPAGDASAADPILLDPDLEASLPAFLNSRRATVAALPRSLEDNDRATFRRLAHRLAGSFALYGFRWAAAQSRLLERDALEGKAAKLAARTAALQEHLDTVTIRIAPKRAASP